MTSLAVHDLGTIPYDDALRLQRAAVESIQHGQGIDTLYLLEHPHVITLGRNARSDHLIASEETLLEKNVAVVETDRGGDITYHGPGQLVGYPIIHLEERRRDIKRYVFDLEQALIDTLSIFSIVGRRDPANRGVWVGERKIASVGVRISRWVTSHGFALNVHTDLSYFSLINPCGIVGCRLTTMSRELGGAVDVDEVKRVFVDQFARVYGRTVKIPFPTLEETSHG